MDEPPSNENSMRWLKADPDTPYVEKYVEEMLAHFTERKIHFGLVARELTEALIKLAPGKPYEKLPDDFDLRAGLSCLTPAAHTLKTRIDAYYKARDRVQAARIERVAAKHGCSLEEAFAIWVAAKEDPNILETGLPPEQQE